ncbi:MAG: 4-(cytidine 5'-diphospho)-2-C-methyl-D-erythritol kinase [Sutterellaceae bacterium]|nr:4-(cytidine 5'-diphospho)-2-C-methyl-D-erythritol kinase [Sutterellaceae bacterium]
MPDATSAYTFSAPAKFNLFLHVTGRRDDGMHLLESIFVLVDLIDTLTFEILSEPEIVRTGDVVGDVNQDLCVRAAKLLQEETGCTLGAKIDVKKRIPSGAGLGGGSSDCATTLMALNRLWNLGLTNERLMKLGNRLGADVPFFIFGTSALARGTGNVLEKIEVPESHWAMIMPETPTSTQLIFRDPDLTRDTKSLKIALLSDQIRLRWPELPGKNDLQAVAVRVNPRIQTALDALGSEARMTGSGSAVFAWASSQEQAQEKLKNTPAGMRGYAFKNLSEHPFEKELKATL